MPVLIEAGADLLPICCLVVLIGMLMATAYTFEKVAGVLDIQIDFGFFTARPFHGLAVTIRNTIIRWCEAGIRHLEKALADLLHGLAWLIREQMKAITAFAHAAEDSLGLLRRHEIPGLIHAALRAPTRAIASLRTDLTALRRTVAADVTSLRTAIRAAESTAIRTAESYADRLFHSLQTQLLDRIGRLERTVAGELNAIPGEISAAERTFAARLAAAEGAIEGELGSLEDTLATVNARLQAEIDRLADEVGTAGLAALLTGLLAVVAEAGLDNAACRTKVRGICASDPGAWAATLGLFAALGFGLSLRELVPLTRPLVGVLAEAERALS